MLIQKSDSELEISEIATLQFQLDSSQERRDG